MNLGASSDRIRIVSVPELSPADRAAWAAIVDFDPQLASPFFRPEFAETVAQTREDVRVAVIERDRQTVGFFPFQTSAMSVGRPVGGPLSDYQGLILRPGVQCNPSRIVRACGLAEWRFDHMLATQQSFTPYHRVETHSPIIDLSQGFESYVEGRRNAGSEQIKKAAALLRKLEREVGPVRFEVHSTETRFLRKLLRWKSRQYRLSGKLDIFAIQWVASVVQKLYGTQQEHFAGLFSVLTVGDLPIAGHMGLRSKRVWHYWFPAYDPGYAKYSPGIILLLKMAEHAGDMGITTIDMGSGRALYKQRLMNGSVAIAEGTVPGSLPRKMLSSAANRTEAWLRHSAVFNPLRKAHAAVGNLADRLPLMQRLISYMRFR